MKRYTYFITILFISIQYFFGSLNLAASNDFYLTEDQKTDEQVCQFAEFSKAFAAERDRRKLDCEILSSIFISTSNASLTIDSKEELCQLATFETKFSDGTRVTLWNGAVAFNKRNFLTKSNELIEYVNLSFSPNASLVAYFGVEKGNRNASTIHVSDIYGNELGIVFRGNEALLSGELYWSQDSKELLYFYDDSYFILDIMFSSRRKVSNPPKNLFAIDYITRNKIDCNISSYITNNSQATLLYNTFETELAQYEGYYSTTPTSAELLAAQQEAEALKQQLAELEAQQSQTQQATSADTQIPLITITRADTDDKQGIVAGRVSDNVGVAEVTVDGNVVPLSSNGGFEYSTYVPATGKTVEVQVTDLAGLSSSQTVTLERNVNLATASISFDELNPIAKQAKRNNNALALIIGVSDYENTPAKATFADSDAMVFRDYASEKLGIPDNRIKTLVNDGADEREMLLAVQTWLSRSVKQDQTDVYVFFAGHGLASDDGQNMYLLPYDGSPELLDDTAILRDRLFNDISKSNPRSVTVFLDTCYSGSNRGSEMLIADARPILLKAKDTSVPDGFTVFTAAAGDETAKSLEEAKHGLFSYFLMKGMEGDADTNGDKQITAGELHTYVKSNVVQQSSGTQTPELQGDANRVLVRFQ